MTKSFIFATPYSANNIQQVMEKEEDQVLLQVLVLQENRTKQRVSTGEKDTVRKDQRARTGIHSNV